MKVTKATIEAAHQALFGITGVNKEGQQVHLPGVLDFPPGALTSKGQYWVQRLSGILEVEHKPFMATRATLIKQYGEKKDAGYQVPPERLETFQAELQTVLDIEVDMSWTPITMPASDIQPKLQGTEMHSFPIGRAWLALAPFLDFAEPVDEPVPNGKEVGQLHAVK